MPPLAPGITSVLTSHAVFEFLLRDLGTSQLSYIHFHSPVHPPEMPYL